MDEKKKAALLAQNDPEENSLKTSLSAFDAAVKRNDLRSALDTAELAPRDTVKLLHQYFPSFDKTVLSKCCRPDKYGCVLHPDGYAAIRLLLGAADSAEEAPQETNETPVKRQSKSHHKFTCRVAGRLPDDTFLALQRYIRMEGWETTNDWVVAQVNDYIKEMDKKYGNNP